MLATMHGKERVIAPILERELGLKVLVPENFDTDQFGTFTMDIPRTGNQLEAARLKVRAAMKATCIDLGIASEGSFGTDPHIPFIQSNLELLLLVDDKNSIEIRGHHRSSATNSAGTYVSNAEEALDFAKKIGFPDHGVVVRKREKSRRFLHKGITTEEELRLRVNEHLQKIFTKRVYVGTDMRAHMNPTRMENIAMATKDLVQNATSECPHCRTPGFSIIAVKRGLICGGCGSPTDSPVAYVKKCQKCNLEKIVPIEDKTFENPSNCNQCNP